MSRTVLVTTEWLQSNRNISSLCIPARLKRCECGGLEGDCRSIKENHAKCSHRVPKLLLLLLSAHPLNPQPCTRYHLGYFSMNNLQSNISLLAFLHNHGRLQRGEEKRLAGLVISIEIYLVARVGGLMVVLEELYWYCLIRNIKAWRKTIILDFLISSPYKALYHKIFIRNIRNKK